MARTCLFLYLVLFSVGVGLAGETSVRYPGPTSKPWTVICYMNGDNDLGIDVLNAVDMMETVGSSDTVNVLALVDAHPAYIEGWEPSWQSTRLLYLQKDHHIGRIHSRIIHEPGELNMADPATLIDFIRFCRTHYPAERYLFAAFTHGRGIIDYRSLSPPENCRSLTICPDRTSSGAMSIHSFADAVRSGMADRPFDLMVLSTCLTNMIEVGYAVKDTTRYLIASEDEIHLVNNPPGRFQLRGIRLERLIDTLGRRPQADIPALARDVVDDYIDQYDRDIWVPGINSGLEAVRYPGTLAAMDATAYDATVRALDHLASVVIQRIGQDLDAIELADRIDAAADEAVRFRSFLNLEYYDLDGFLRALGRQDVHPDIKDACGAALQLLNEQLLVHKRHTQGHGSGGISVYFPDRRIPENVFRSHHSMYRQSRFSQETAWDEMIEQVRYLHLQR